MGEEGLEDFSGQAKAVEAAGDVFEAEGLLDSLLIESAAAPLVGLQRVVGEIWMEAVEVIEEDEVGFAAEVSGYTEQAVGLEPEVVGGEVVDRRIDKEDFHFLVRGGSIRTSVESIRRIMSTALGAEGASRESMAAFWTSSKSIACR